MSGKSSSTKTVHLDEEVHAAVSVLAAIKAESMQQLIDQAIRDQYDIGALLEMAEDVSDEQTTESTDEIDSQPAGAEVASQD